MRVEAGEVTAVGRAVDLPDLDVDAATVAAAVRGEDAPLAVGCPPPGPVHERVGLVTEASSLRVRTALAAAARSRGLTAPQDAVLERVRERLDAVEAPSVDLEAARRRVAAAGEDEARLRERVAELRGRVRALREAGRSPAEAREALSEAVRSLSEVETDRLAAEQTLERARSRARDARAARDRRLRLEDRAANLRRAARAHLVAAVREEYASAVEAAPGGSAAADPFEADPVTASLAVARVADLEAPVVLDCGRFPDAAAAADWLDAPVIRL